MPTNLWRHQPQLPSWANPQSQFTRNRNFSWLPIFFSFRQKKSRVRSRIEETIFDGCSDLWHRRCPVMCWRKEEKELAARRLAATYQQPTTATTTTTASTTTTTPSDTSTKTKEPSEGERKKKGPQIRFRDRRRSFLSIEKTLDRNNFF